MGTRGVITFVLDGQTKSVYQHWDSYESYTIPKLQAFLRWNQSRNTDLHYTVANFIFYSKMTDYLQQTHEKPTITNIKKAIYGIPDQNDGFHTGYGIVDQSMEGFWSIEYVYRVDLRTLKIEVNPSSLEVYQ
jgi:hypothetical protein